MVCCVVPPQERTSGYEFKQYLVRHCLEWAQATTSDSEGLLEKEFFFYNFHDSDIKEEEGVENTLMVITCRG